MNSLIPPMGRGISWEVHIPTLFRPIVIHVAVVAIICLGSMPTKGLGPSPQGNNAANSTMPFSNIWTQISEAKFLDLIQDPSENIQIEASAGPQEKAGTTASPKIGEGDNLILFSDQVENLKKLYNQARKYLNADDAVLLGGYIVKLDKLDIQILQAFPVAEIALYAATVQLSSKVINVVVRGLRIAKQTLEIIFRTLALQIAIENARSKGLYTTSLTPPLFGMILRDSTVAASSSDPSDGDTKGPTSMGATRGLSSDPTIGSDISSKLFSTTDKIVEASLPLYLSSEFVNGPLTLCSELLVATSDALNSLNDRLL